MITDLDIKRLTQSITAKSIRVKGKLQLRIGSTIKYAAPHEFGACRPIVLGTRIKHLPGKGNRS